MTESGLLHKNRRKPTSVVPVEAGRTARELCHSFGKTVSGGLEPGGLIERMKAMIFHSWSES